MINNLSLFFGILFLTSDDQFSDFVSTIFEVMFLRLFQNFRDCTNQRVDYQIFQIFDL